MIPRSEHVARILELLNEAPVVAILGARQVGKTTLAEMVCDRWPGEVVRFDLEEPEDLAALADPMLALRDRSGLVVLDEIQRRPELFPALRVLADRPPSDRRFLVLGSASPDLLRQSSESLAGRIAFHDLSGFSLGEIGPAQLGKLWIRGGFPRSFLAGSDERSDRWRRNFIRTFLERDLPQLGVTIGATTLRRFWAMLSHYHGQVWNASEFGRSFGVADTTVRRYLDLLCDTFVVRLLPPYVANLRKRQVKSPKVYFRDSGLLHSFLDVPGREALERHPKVGASWEGFALETTIHHLGARPEECYFWATHTGAELDLVVEGRGRRLGFEFKRTTAPKVTPSMRNAREDLDLEQIDVLHAGERTFPLSRSVRAVAFRRILEDVEPL